MRSFAWLFALHIFVEFTVSASTQMCNHVILEHDPIFNHLKSAVVKESMVDTRLECVALCTNVETVTSKFSLNEMTGHCICGAMDPNNVSLAPHYKYYCSEQHPQYAVWVDSVIGKSTQYDDSRFAAWKALGEPDVYPEYGDLENTWTHTIPDTDIWLEVKTSCFLLVKELHIYETYNSGSLKRIALRDVTATWTEIWTTASAQTIGVSRIFKPTFTPLTVPTDGVRLEAFYLGGSHVEIDTVMVVGEISEYITWQWVEHVIDKSTEYEEWRFAAFQALGMPDVYPIYGDRQEAWTHTIADQDIWIELRTKMFLEVQALHIYETYNSGSLKRIALKDAYLNWHEIWTSPVQQSIGVSRVFVPSFTALSVPTDGVRLEAFYLNGNHVEIDAIGVVGTVSRSLFPVWLDSVTNMSSQYSTDAFAAWQILGPPNVYPEYGDIERAWTHVYTDPDVWIEVTTSHCMLVQELHIYETYNSGSLKRIALSDIANTWIEIWTSTAAQTIGSSRIFKPVFTLHQPAMTTINNPLMMMCNCNLSCQPRKLCQVPADPMADTTCHCHYYAMRGWCEYGDLNTTCTTTCSLRQAISCGELPNFQNAVQVGGRRFLDWVTYVCSQGYRNNGDVGRRVCNEDGFWTVLSPDPYCVEESGPVTCVQRIVTSVSASDNGVAVLTERPGTSKVECAAWCYKTTGCTHFTLMTPTCRLYYKIDRT